MDSGTQAQTDTPQGNLDDMEGQQNLPNIQDNSHSAQAEPTAMTHT